MDTVKPVGHNFCVPGHVIQEDFTFMLLKKIDDKDAMVKLVWEYFVSQNFKEKAISRTSKSTVVALEVGCIYLHFKLNN